MTARDVARDTSPADPRDGSTRRAPRPLGRPCGWCRVGLEATRRDARYCSKRCRQAASRATIQRADQVAADRPMRLAYADPPYPGNARRYYGSHPDFAGEVDHAALLSRLASYDGWALSTSARALPAVLALCVAQGLTVRVGAWMRGARPHATAHVVNAWEPVVFAGGRDTSDGTPDALIAVARARPTLPTSVVGMKPPAFIEWVFRLLGAQLGDELDDLFPGSGLVTRSWHLYQGRDPSRVAGAVHLHVATDLRDRSVSPVDERDTSRGSAGDMSRLAAAGGGG